MDMIQDWMIINKIKMGDPDAWDILVHKYYDSVYFYCVRRCYGDCDIASDLTQDIFLKLVESLPRYRFIGKFQNYLYTMAVNTCNNYLKKRHIEQIELTDKVPCTEDAAGMGGSQIWLEVGEELTVDEMLKAICVVSANDCTEQLRHL